MEQEPHLSSKYLDFLGNLDEDEIRIVCRECGAELQTQKRGAEFDYAKQQGVFDHLLKFHRVTEVDVRDDIQRITDEAIDRGEIDPPFGSRN